MNEINLSSERLAFRLVALSDLDKVHELHSIPEVDQYNTLGIPQDLAVTESIVEAWIAGHQLPEIQNHVFFITEKASGDFIGLLGFSLGKAKYRRGEVWYKFYPRYWGQGYATETVQTALDYGFNSLHLHRIEAGCAVGNIGSIKVLEKVGMTREGCCRKTLPLKSGWSDNYEYAILENDERKPRLHVE